MGAYRHGAHRVCEIRLHLAGATKYRKPVPAGQVGIRVRGLIREVCGSCDVLIIRGHVRRDRVHPPVSTPPRVTIRRLVPRLKGEAASELPPELAHIRKEFRGRHVRARGYFGCGSGDVTAEVVARYIAEQGRGHDGKFRVEAGP